MNKYTLAALTIALSIVASCSATRFNLPPISADSDSASLPGKIIWHDLLTDTPQASRRFYSTLFGWEFEALPGGVNYELIRHRGRLIGGMVDQTRLPNQVDISQWVVAMAVMDIDIAAQEVRDAGGEVLTPPVSLGDRGSISIVSDVSGALLALLQTSNGDPADSDLAVAQGDFLWHELWVEDPDQAAGFYQRLAPFDIEKTELQGVAGSVQYRILRAQGKPRVGIRSTPAEGARPMWVSYLRVADSEALDALLSTVETLDGKILVPSTARPDGGRLAIIQGPSGSGIALQTWPDDRVTPDRVTPDQASVIEGK